MNEDRKTVYETLIHLSNVYFSTGAECGVTVRQRHFSTPPLVLKKHKLENTRLKIKVLKLLQIYGQDSSFGIIWLVGKGSVEDLDPLYP